ncbi:hypothetical protein RhiirC2_704442 [Rhizophagus irregularis]|uniref:Ion transport domain-containing protein n=1 Tax=Rhizophagus irregularis TaxID=588596 RepID=A0A2N1P1X9_9GLOM|nr:hypothetical protein RhiirC2_704442 [Rhizophagus irregularis]
MARKKVFKDDDLNFDKRKNESKDISNELQNNMELAIYHYKGKDTTIVACLLEYYSNHAMDDVGWMCTVSKAIPLLFEYNYGLYYSEIHDNPFTTFSKSILAAYFWINGNWIQRDEFDFWIVDLYTFIASIFLVIVLQNMLIAFMSDEYEAVKEKSRQILLKYKANRIADYEALNHVHLFSNPESQPKYIFYHGLPESYEKWYNIRKDDSKSVIYDNTKEFDFEKFKISDYDQYSIWKYNNYSNIIRISTENFKNNFSNKIETLIKKFKDEKQIDEIEKYREILKDEFHKISINGIEKVKKYWKINLKKLKKC